MNEIKAHRALLLPLLLAGVAASAPAQDPPSEEAIAFFEANYMSCHTIGGGRLTGPDLKGVTERQEPDWLAKFIMDPKAVIDSGDPYAAELFREALLVPSDLLCCSLHRCGSSALPSTRLLHT